MNLSEVYRAYGEDSEVGAQARLLLDQQHWYASIAEFDPKTGDALPLAFDEVLHRLVNRTETAFIRDRLWRIVDHCRLSLEHIFSSLSENPRREQAYLPDPRRQGAQRDQLHRPKPSSGAQRAREACGQAVHAGSTSIPVGRPSAEPTGQGVRGAARRALGTPQEVPRS